MTNNYCVILAGGIGSRFWPFSRETYPKQFLDFFGTGRSLLQITYDRFAKIIPTENIYIATNESYADLVKQQLPQLRDNQVLLEPTRRNTAPCIAYACWKIAKRHPDANIIVTPADALVLNTDAFNALIYKALDFSAAGSRIVTAGIVPDHPETGYGYICAEGDARGRIAKVQSFKEKPDMETAVEYLRSGNYYWNAGIFIWTVRTIVAQIRKHAPQIAGIMDRLSPHLYTDNESAALEELFPQCEKISIDYAVMEKSDDIYVISDNLGWSDLGNWSAVLEHLERDADGNAAIGHDIRLYGCKDCIVHAQESDTVVVEGLEKCIVSAKGGRLLVCSLAMEQKIKDFSA